MSHVACTPSVCILKFFAERHAFRFLAYGKGASGTSVALVTYVIGCYQLAFCKISTDPRAVLGAGDDEHHQSHCMGGSP